MANNSCNVHFATNISQGHFQFKLSFQHSAARSIWNAQLPWVAHGPSTVLGRPQGYQDCPPWRKKYLYFVFMRHWQPIRSKLGFYFRSGITLDIYVIFLWRTFYWSIEDKTHKKLKEIHSRHVLENLPEKARNFSFIHLIGNLQGLCQYIMEHMLNISISI